MVAIDFPSFMELRFIDMKEKEKEWLLTSSQGGTPKRLSKTSKAELDGAISILAWLPAFLILHIPHTFTSFFLLRSEWHNEAEQPHLPPLKLIALMKLRSSALKRFWAWAIDLPIIMSQFTTKSYSVFGVNVLI